MWPPTPRAWLRYEHYIRRAAGMGRAAVEADPDRYEHQYAHCDVLVIGGGVAGLAAAQTAARSGVRVIVCQQAPLFASKTADEQRYEGDDAAREWLTQVRHELADQPHVTLLPRTTAYGYYDGNLVGAVERITDHLPAPPAHLPRQRMWMIRARAVVLATGAIERGIAYANNDLPGTMLAGAASTYIERYGVRPGSRAVVFANHDRAYAAAMMLYEAGVSIAAIIDPRLENASAGHARRAQDAGLTVLRGCVIRRARGRHHVSGVDVDVHGGGARRSLDCDLVAVSGGYSPAVHLFSQARGTLRYDEPTASFMPDRSPLPIFAAGSINGAATVQSAIDDGDHAARRAIAQVTRPSTTTRVGPDLEGSRERSAVERLAVEPLWSVPGGNDGKCFVDLQDDVTVRDIALAAREGYRAVEHLKRYTTLGMGTDQGKTSNVIGLAVMAQLLGVSIPEVGTTTFRPPFTPVTLGAFPGAGSGGHVAPTRYTAMHEWHAEQGARFVNAGSWKRPHSYPRAGESEDDAANREVLNVRRNVGIVDVSTLGKIELQGRDVAEFLNRVYANRFDNLQVNRCRYGIMLREDGFVRDDGTTSRLDSTHYLVTTTTANAVSVMQLVERLLQVDWPELDVYATSVTENWAAAAISGPKSRALVAGVVDIDVSNEAFPFLAVASCNVRTANGIVPARLFRMSYSGELAYELHVPSRHGRAMWDALIDAGTVFDVMPYGTEAMNTLRVEKGHVVIGSEIDGRTTAADLGMEKLVNAGKWCHRQAARLACRIERIRTAGSSSVLTAPRGAQIPRGGKIVADPEAHAAQSDAWARHVVVLQPSRRRVDRSGARRRRARAPRRQRCGRCRRCQRDGAGEDRPAGVSSMRPGSGCVADARRSGCNSQRERSIHDHARRGSAGARVERTRRSAPTRDFAEGANRLFGLVLPLQPNTSARTTTRRCSGWGRTSWLFIASPISQASRSTTSGAH
jgi:sarcosine oxidase subunit alpha